ncbi:MAG: ribosome biogenesis GTPase Der, partial [Anaerolineales bacterium]|nr:ribosome biogenesis GTPase Der [Anaerolineales bacterium]
DLVDTGGIEAAGRRADAWPLASHSAAFISEIRAQSQLAINEADVVTFMTDASAGVTATDTQVADMLRRAHNNVPGRKRPPLLLAVNKCDNASRRAYAQQFFELGLGEPYPIAALHGTGCGDLLDAIVAQLPATPSDTNNDAVAIAIVGRPNVGKSSLLNKLLGQERVIVSPVAGTTRDAIDTGLTYHGTDITLIDTAGIRRRGKIVPGVEKYSVLRALKAIDRAEVVLLMVDATEPFTSQDAHIAGIVLDKARSAIVIVNKWDAIPKDNYTMDTYRTMVRETLQFLDYVPVLFVSALTGQRVNKTLPLALKVHTERYHRVPTAELNRVVRAALGQHAPPSRGGKRLRIFYATQVATAPPVILMHINDHKLLHFSYTRFLENQIRARFEFTGTPLRLAFRERSD